MFQQWNVDLVAHSNAIAFHLFRKYSILFMLYFIELNS